MRSSGVTRPGLVQDLKAQMARDKTDVEAFLGQQSAQAAQRDKETDAAKVRPSMLGVGSSTSPPLQSCNAPCRDPVQHIHAGCAATFALP